jgi:nitrogen regulatory protein PII
MTMGKLVVLITAQVEQVHQIGEAWHKVGAPGITVIEGFGLQGLNELKASAEVLPGAMSLLEIMRENEPGSMVLLTVVEDSAVVESLQRETEAILGDLRAPNNGIFFTIDVDRAVGIQRHST